MNIKAVSLTSIALGTLSCACSSDSTGDAPSTGTGGLQSIGGMSAGGAINGSGGGTSSSGGLGAGGMPVASGGSGGSAPSAGGAPQVAGSGGMITGGASGTAAITGGAAGASGVPGAGGAAGAGGVAAMNGAGGAAGNGTSGPCDIYARASTPCVAAHSTTRALYGAYAGNLYQVKRASDNTTKDIKVLAAGGFADAASQDDFCRGTTCTISIIYDQSSKGNALTPAPAGGAVKTPDRPVNASRSKLTAGGHSVYAAYFEGGMGYRNNRTAGIATGDAAESMYMVTSGTHYNSLCCFDYRNAETDSNDDGNGTMEAIYFGNQHTYWGWGNVTPGASGGVGPWVEADLENGLFAGNVFGEYKPNTSVSYTFVTAMVKGKPGGFAIKAGDANNGTLKTMYEGARPGPPNFNGYNPMKKQGAIILGIGGDNSNGSQGTFYEGCMTTGYADDATDAAVQANIIAAGYGH